ncbi:MAG: M16 family metallopeptidase [Armatimonadota bacterium]
MVKRCFGVTAVLLAVLLAAASAAGAQLLQERVTEHTLKNGMKFLLVERHQAPVFSAVIAFKAGGVDEAAGESGLAHLLEHMAFKGTQVIGTKNYRREKRLLEKMDSIAVELARLEAAGRPEDAERISKLRAQLQKAQQEAAAYVVPNELDRIYSVNGAEDLNAWTSKDMTAYVVSLPSNKFELWALIESQRMATPVLREFYAERDVVCEERLQSVENSPFGKLYEVLIATAFAAHPYRTPTGGWMSDLRTLTRPQAERFRRTYYVPGNAVAALVGDFRTEDAVPILEKYFGAIPPGPPPPPVVTKEDEQSGEKRVKVEFAAQPHLIIAYHKPTLPSDDDFVFDVLNAVLTEGRTSRLYSALVKKNIALSVSSWTSEPGARYPNLFLISAVPMHPHSVEDLERAIYAELERLKNELISNDELEKAKSLLTAEFLRGLQTNMDLAEKLAYYQTVAGDWRYILRWEERIRGITAQDIQRVARRYLVERNRVVAAVVPPSGKEEGVPAERAAGGAEQ